MRLRRLVLVTAAVSALTAVPAAAGEVTIHDPVQNCDHTYGWNIDTADPRGTRVYSAGNCTG